MFIVLLAVGCGTNKPEEQPPDISDPPAAAFTSSTNSPAAPDGRPIILAFGDSLTEGHGLPLGSAYPAMLQAELDRKGYKYQVINAGVGGDTTGQGLARLSQGLELHPEVVILELGGNDGLRGTPITSMQSNLEEMIVAFQKGGAKVLLAGMTLPRNLGPDYIGAFEKVYVDLAAMHKVTLIPFFLEGAAGNPELNLDEIHPNEAGYRIVTANVLKYLEPMLKK
jgi:acyl-CoA thioesterase I